MTKPIRIFYTELVKGHGTFWATQHYKEEIKDGYRTFLCTGKKYDVTQDVAHIIVAEDIEFKSALAGADTEGEG